MRTSVALILLIILSMSCNTSRDLSASNDFHKRKYFKGKYVQTKHKKRSIKSHKAVEVKADAIVEAEEIVEEKKIQDQFKKKQKIQETIASEKAQATLDDESLTSNVNESRFFDIFPSFNFKKQKALRASPPSEKEDNTVGIVGFSFAILSVLSLILAGATGFDAFSAISALAAITGFVLGLVALRDFRIEPDRFKGRGLAIAAVAIGATYLFLLVLAFILLAAFFSGWSSG